VLASQRTISSGDRDRGKLPRALSRRMVSVWHEGGGVESDSSVEAPSGYLFTCPDSFSDVFGGLKLVGLVSRCFARSSRR